MLDIKTSNHPAFTSNSQHEWMQFSCALLIICSNSDAICRRKKWGRTVMHVYAEVCSDDVERLIMVNEAGCLSLYTPSIEDLIAGDWLAG